MFFLIKYMHRMRINEDPLIKAQIVELVSWDDESDLYSDDLSIMNPSIRNYIVQYVSPISCVFVPLN